LKNDSKFSIIKTEKFKKFENAILIEGLPGIANVSRICVDFLIEKLEADKLCDIYSNAFPNSVIVTEDSSIKLFKVELYHSRVNEKDLIFLIGDIQPSNDKDSYDLAQYILNLCKELGVKTVITLGGAGISEGPNISRVHGVATDKSFIKQLKPLGVVFDGNDTIKLIVGAAGLLLGLGELMGFSGFSLLVETISHPQHIGIKEARAILKILIKYLNLDISLKDLDEEIKDIEEEIKAEAQMAREARKQQLMAIKPRYIG